jgi:hypothetical protein
MKKIVFLVYLTMLFQNRNLLGVKWEDDNGYWIGKDVDR